LILADDVFLEEFTPSSIAGDVDDQWMKDKSKEELSQLLLKAEGIIQRRQHGLLDFLFNTCISHIRLRIDISCFGWQRITTEKRRT
jgi:hypothetical protein